MSYGADFATADPANAPLDAPLLVGADPFVWGAILLALIVAGMIGWLMASGSRSKKGDATPAIWDAIDSAAKDAMKADTDSLPARAAELQRVVKARLGRTLAFGGGLTGCMKSLDAALKGEIEDKAGHAHHAHGPAHPPAEAHGHEDGEAHGQAPAAAASVTIVSVHAPPAPAHPHPHPEHPKPGKRPMTTQERNDALRLAVAAFNDYWRHRSAREGDMRAVIAELSDPGPRRPHLSHGGGRH